MSYDSITGHRSMAMDEVRNATYLRALEQVITPESVVLDLGAGLGSLGMLAARLGARRVYLVESAEVVSVTRRIVRDNGLEDRVRVLHGRLEDLDLPEKVDVITSVMTGNFLLSEDLLPSLFHARDRYLKPGGVLLPSEAVMEVVPVSFPKYYDKNVAGWLEDHLGLDFGAGHESAVNTVHWGWREFDGAKPLSPAQDLFAMDLRTAATTHCDASVEVQVDKEGILHGWLGWFRMKLGEEWLTTSPFAPQLHWGAAFLPAPEALPVAAGETIGLSVLRPPQGDWTWGLRVGARSFRQSTFFSSALTLRALASQAVGATPRLSARGQAVRAVLDAMDGGHSLEDLAALLCERSPREFASGEDALGEVRRLARRLGEAPSEGAGDGAAGDPFGVG